MTTLGGSLMVCRGLNLDYCFLEAIESLLPVCDEVAVLLFSDEDLEALKQKFNGERKLIVQKKTEAEFDARPGKERLPYFTNIARDMTHK